MGSCAGRDGHADLARFLFSLYQREGACLAYLMRRDGQGQEPPNFALSVPRSLRVALRLSFYPPPPNRTLAPSNQLWLSAVRQMTCPAHLWTFNWRVQMRGTPVHLRNSMPGILSSHQIWSKWQRKLLQEWLSCYACLAQILAHVSLAYKCEYHCHVDLQFGGISETALLFLESAKGSTGFDNTVSVCCV